MQPLDQRPTYVTPVEPQIGQVLSSPDTYIVEPQKDTKRGKRLLLIALFFGSLLASIAAIYYFAVLPHKEASTPYTQEKHSQIPKTNRTVTNQNQAYEYVFKATDGIFNQYLSSYEFPDKLINKPQSCGGSFFAADRVGVCELIYTASSNQSTSVADSKAKYSQFTDTLIKDGWKATMVIEAADGAPTFVVIKSSQQLDFNIRRNDPHYTVTFSKTVDKNIQLAMTVLYFSTPRTAQFSYQNYVTLSANYTYKF